MTRFTARRCAGIMLVISGVGSVVSCSRPVDKSDGPSSQTSAPASGSATKPGIYQPLASYDQTITSSQASVTAKAGETLSLPVRIENPGQDTWSSAGSLPVTISYKWFSGTSMLPIEGERTLLPKAIGPKASADVPVRVVAPGQPGNYELRITLVQEGSAWFMTKSNKYLSLAVTVR